MKISRTHPAFISQILVWSLVLVGIAGSSGVAVIWQRQLIAQTANRIKILETALAEVELHQTELYNEIAAKQSLDALLGLNASFRLSLAPIVEQQLVRVNVSPEQRLAIKRNTGTFAAATPRRALLTDGSGGSISSD